MLQDKIARASIISHHIIELAKTDGVTVPARASGRRLATLVEVEPTWRATLTKGQRITFAPVYAAAGEEGNVTYGPRILEDADWTMLELEIGERPPFIVNLRGDEIILHRFFPGKWESWFGAENGGDDVRYEAVFYPAPGSAELKALLQSPDGRLPPLRTGPSGHDAFHQELLRERTRRRRWRKG